MAEYSQFREIEGVTTWALYGLTTEEAYEKLKAQGLINDISDPWWQLAIQMETSTSPETRPDAPTEGKGGAE